MACVCQEWEIVLGHIVGYTYIRFTRAIRQHRLLYPCLRVYSRRMSWIEPRPKDSFICIAINTHERKPKVQKELLCSTWMNFCGRAIVPCLKIRNFDIGTLQQAHTIIRLTMVGSDIWSWLSGRANICDVWMELRV